MKGQTHDLEGLRRPGDDNLVVLPQKAIVQACLLETLQQLVLQVPEVAEAGLHPFVFHFRP